MTQYKENNQEKFVDMFVSMVPTYQFRRSFFTAQATNRILRQYFIPSIAKKFALGQFDRLTASRYFTKNKWWNLESLRLEQGGFFSKLPTSSFGNLRSLELSFIYMDVSFISSLRFLKSLSITGNDMKELPILSSSLQRLILKHNNRLEQIGNIVLATNLQELVLDDNYRIQEYRFIDELTSLTSLTSLIFEDRNRTIANVPFLSNLINLTHLDISCHYIDNLEFIKRFIQLKSLNMCCNNINNTSFVSTLNNLEELTLTITNETTVQDIENLTNLRKLSFMRFNFTNVDVSFLRYLSKLENLEMTGVINFPVDIPFLETIKSLFITGGSFHEKPFMDFSIVSRMRNLNELTLRNFASINLQLLVGLTKLQKLELLGIEIEDLTILLQLPRLITVVSSGIPKERLEIFRGTKINVINY